MKRILAASQCIQKLSANVLERSKELTVKGLLTLNKVQHEPIGKFRDPDYKNWWTPDSRTPDSIMRKAALIMQFVLFPFDPGLIGASTLSLDSGSKLLEVAEGKVKNSTPPSGTIMLGQDPSFDCVQELACVQKTKNAYKKVVPLATIAEMTFLAFYRPDLFCVALAAKLVEPALNKLDQFAMEHGQDWKTRTGGVYVR
jgi:hypothetical protein